MRKRQRKAHPSGIGGSRIEICGGIASGKTTLARLLHNYGVAAELERFEQNPFWNSFYANPRRYAFETEITFLLQHYSQMRDAHDRHEVFVYDTSFIQDLAYARANLDNVMIQPFLAVHEYAKRVLPEPVLVVHLVCDATVELARVRSRRRPQEASIQLDYLALLNEQVRICASEVNPSVPIVEIDSGTNDFANDPAVRERLARRLLNELENLEVEPGKIA